MPNNTKNQLHSTTRIPNGKELTLSKQQDSDSPLSKWYHTITELPLRKYIDCVVDNNLYALVISGEPTKEELTTAWLTISEQFSEAMGDHEQGVITTLYRDISVLTYTKLQALEIILLLSVCLDDIYEAQLNKLLNTKFTFKVPNRRKELDKCTRMTKGLDLKIALKQGQLDNLISKRKEENGEVKPTREYFMAMLISLSDFAKYQIGDNITTFEYCERVRRVSEYVQKQKIK